MMPEDERMDGRTEEDIFLMFNKLRADSLSSVKSNLKDSSKRIATIP